MEIGKYNTLKIIRKAPPGMYLADDHEEEVLLPNKYIEDTFHIGDEIEVFVYCDSSDLPVATTEKPYGTVDEFVCLTVKDITSIGAFLDWGLSKDVLVPFKQQLTPMKKGQQYVVRIYHDTLTNRIVASTKLRPFLKKNVDELKRGEKVELLVYGVQEKGNDVLVNGLYRGYLPVDHQKKVLSIGTKLSAYVGRLNSDSVDLTHSPSYHYASEDADSTILSQLKKENGFLPYHDKSDAEEIRQVFNMSKKNFKKALGNLYKHGKIEILQNGIKLRA